jgi:hypothetical protein
MTNSFLNLADKMLTYFFLYITNYGYNEVFFFGSMKYLPWLSFAIHGNRSELKVLWLITVRFNLIFKRQFSNYFVLFFSWWLYMIVLMDQKLFSLPIGTILMYEVGKKTVFFRKFSLTTIIIVWLFVLIFYSQLSNFSAIQQLSPLTMTRLVNLDLCLALKAARTLLRTTIAATLELGLYGLIWRTVIHVPQWDSSPQHKDHKILILPIWPLRHAADWQQSNQENGFYMNRLWTFIILQDLQESYLV